MVRILVCCFLILQGSACGELQGVVNNFPAGGSVVSNADIAAGLRQALNTGIEQEVSKLAQTNGFYGNPLVKILLPQELQNVENTLRDIGLGKLVDEGHTLLNRAAEEAVKEALPIFVEAVKGITFNDARKILLGNDRAATDYLAQATRSSLYQKFHPVIGRSFEKVGADKVWNSLINNYNNLPLTNNVNPDLTEYVAGEALDGVFIMIALEEKEIRNSLSSRTTELLKRVFALQD